MIHVVRLALLRTDDRLSFVDGDVRLFSSGLSEDMPDGSTPHHSGSYCTHLTHHRDLAPLACRSPTVV